MPIFVAMKPDPQMTTKYQASRESAKGELGCGFNNSFR